MISRVRAGAAGWMVFALVLGGCSGGGGGGTTLPPIVEPPVERPTLPQDYRASGHAAAGDVFVHLFEWKWTDIARECESVLRPAGYEAVQVSPPQEHIVLQGSPWWIRYQPVSYSLGRSRSGTAAEFTAMVNRCNAAGVDIYVDAVINHMTAGAGTGTNGTVYTKYNYPGLYTQADFHPSCGINDYQNAANVQDCELVGLADLNTGAAAVQQKIAGYLVELARLGVAGFRIDAAKHMQPVELDAILDRVNQALAAESRPLPYWFAEVIDHGGEAVRREQYYGLALRHRRLGGHHGVPLPGRGRQVPGRRRPAAGGPEELLPGVVEPDAGGQGRRLSGEPRHAARQRHQLPRAARRSGWRTCGCWRSRTATRR